MTAPWPPEARRHPIDLDGRVSYLEFAGDGPPVVGLHGLGGSALNYGLLGPLLGRRLLVPDLFGHGGSDAGSGDPLAANLGLIGRFVDEVAGGPVLLVGHSLGAVLAVLHTVRAPSSVERLVLMDPPVPNRTRLPRDPKLTAKYLLLKTPGVSGIVAKQLAKLSPEEVVRKQLSDATPHVDRLPAEVIAASVAETTERASRPDAAAAQRFQWDAIVATVALLAKPAAWRAQLARITVPTLYLQGLDDKLARPADAADLAATRPDWDFRTRGGVGHLPHLEDPAWAAAQIQDWLGG